MIFVGPDRPDHLLPFDRYTVLTAETDPVEHGHINSALRSASELAQAFRVRVVIRHERFGDVAAVRPVGGETVVLWLPHPGFAGPDPGVTGCLLVVGFLVWLMGAVAWVVSY